MYALISYTLPRERVSYLKAENVRRVILLHFNFQYYKISMVKKKFTFSIFFSLRPKQELNNSLTFQSVKMLTFLLTLFSVIRVLKVNPLHCYRLEMMIRARSTVSIEMRTQIWFQKIAVHWSRTRIVSSVCAMCLPLINV
jgi:hypothetical protein